MKSLVTRVFFEFTPVFPENSLAQGLQLQLSFLGTERVKGKCLNANYSPPSTNYSPPSPNPPRNGRQASYNPQLISSALDPKPLWVRKTSLSKWETVKTCDPLGLCTGKTTVYSYALNGSMFDLYFQHTGHHR